MTVAQAAQALGVTVPTVHSLIRDRSLTASAGPRGQLVTRAEVFAVASKRRVDAVRRHPDLLGFARSIKAAVWPPEPATVELTDGRTENRDADEVAAYMRTPKGRDALSWLPRDAVALFGPAVISTLADLKSLRAAGACPWCWARATAAVRGGIGPSDHPAIRELIGNPCPKDIADMGANRNAIDRLWREVKAEDHKRRAQAARVARAREIEAATADVDRATRRLRQAKGALTASGPGDAAAAFELRRQAREARTKGRENLAHQLELRADKLERTGS
ncbi:helix-turn-helix domain-containing protein [Streptomyces sp. NBC_00588]|uniref:helix-turn-helix domain-containing protein n=1 Tax=Streptomyces sp. NBC_00588 TaxID=2975784 RepID=UPI002E81D79A|nr:helix-turn-helix domain-containing protein [Streptomyces sp. NBC_00588]WUB35518.1 helix-turn-helix domain-containing protein [Streptomyces sp. NBC_00588]